MRIRQARKIIKATRRDRFHEKPARGQTWARACVRAESYLVRRMTKEGR